jgi:hypothetical protein
MEINVRKAGLKDLKHLLHHRRAMFEEMGFQDLATLDRVDDVSREYSPKPCESAATKPGSPRHQTAGSSAVAGF